MYNIIIMENGFDNGIDYEPIRLRLKQDFNQQLKKFRTSGFTKRSSKGLIFIMIEMVQLRNGSRITEAINAFKQFSENGTAEMVMVKVCKSEARKMAWVLSKDKKTKELKEITTKPRYRKMMFPLTWIKEKVKNIDSLIAQVIKIHPTLLDNPLLKSGVRKYMQRHHGTNTHSLRYAFINYLLYEKERPISDVAKFVGHVNVDQMVRYTQQKNSDQIFYLEM